MGLGLCDWVPIAKDKSIDSEGHPVRVPDREMGSVSPEKGKGSGRPLIGRGVSQSQRPPVIRVPNPGDMHDKAQTGIELRSDSGPG